MALAFAGIFSLLAWTAELIHFTGITKGSGVWTSKTQVSMTNGIEIIRFANDPLASGNALCWEDKLGDGEVYRFVFVRANGESLDERTKPNP